MPKISIIIPVYNTEKYLPKCIDSVINQTFSNIEIICINDGSTDKSLEILNDYEQKDNRIIVLSQENSKQGTARNRGLEIAKGEYIVFLDSDDWLDLNYLEEMLNSIEQSDSCVAISVSTRDYTNKVKKHVEIKHTEIISDINELLPKINYDLRVTGKMYKKSVLCDIRFLEYAFYEDAPYAIRALNQADKYILVPNTTYHYFSNPTSTIKKAQNERKRNDIIETQLDLINYANDNHIKLKDNFVIKDEKLLFKTKVFTNRKEYYFCGIKYFTKFESYNPQKIFVVIQVAYLGDVLLCNSLFQNIKIMYPNSKTIFVVNKSMEEAAKYQKDVDEVIVFDKRGEHKGLFGLLKFIRAFPYKKIDYVFKTYDNFRVDWIARFLKPRIIVGKPYDMTVSVQHRHNLLLKKITHKKIQNYPIVYNADNNIPQKFENILTKNEEYVALCTTTKRKIKDMPLKQAEELINKLGKDGKKVVFVGVGEDAENYALELQHKGYNIINLINQTTIYELAQVLRNCEALISVDTGTMHFGYANNVPTYCVFYEEDKIQPWAPDKKLYPKTNILSKRNIDIIYKTLLNI